MSEKHVLSKLAKDDQGRYFCVCTCSEVLRAYNPEDLATKVGKHLGLKPR